VQQLSLPAPQLVRPAPPNAQLGGEPESASLPDPDPQPGTPPELPPLEVLPKLPPEPTPLLDPDPLPELPPLMLPSEPGPEPLPPPDPPPDDEEVASLVAASPFSWPWLELVPQSAPKPMAARSAVAANIRSAVKGSTYNSTPPRAEAVKRWRVAMRQWSHRCP